MAIYKRKKRRGAGSAPLMSLGREWGPGGLGELPPRRAPSQPKRTHQALGTRGGARLAATRAGGEEACPRARAAGEGACPAGGRTGGRRRGPGARRSVLCWNVRLPRARGATADRAPPRPRAPDRGSGELCDGRARAGGLIPLRDRPAGLACLGAQLFPALSPLPRKSSNKEKELGATAAATRGRRSVGAQASG